MSDEPKDANHLVAEALLDARIEVENHLETCRELVNNCLGMTADMNSVPALIIANRRLEQAFTRLKAFGELHEKVVTP